MKTLQNIALIIFFTLTSSGFTQANPKPTLAMDQVLTAYIDCTTQGNLENVHQVFSENFRHTINRNGKPFSINKKEMLDFLKETKNVQLNCKTSYSIVEESGDCVIAKVSMQYDLFTKVDLVTLCRGTNGWEVSQVISTYP